ncbi:MAG TPA: hypothetical protein DDY58_06865 [Terrisporobacter glycolicus]|uniref:DUF975 family protein n=1 Tax=Terrisporobacter TaxID=1505652 RepID=UPI000E88079E|nr:MULTISPECIES: DUF975 family protein [Terrisporobacter]MBN9647222.1 DUF975 family protein [Terrisporobacter glycolicus]HBI92162.1 hypothetical protein [Terrisporobacter hibernicus]
MWIRSELKERGKITFKRFYWKAVLVCFICLLLSGGLGSGAGSRISDTYDSFMNKDYNYTDDYDYGNDEYYYEEDLDQETSQSLNIVEEFFTSGLFYLLMGIFILIFIVLFIIKLLIVYPIEIGKNNFFMGIREEEKTLDSLIFIYKSGQLKNTIFTMFMKGLFQFLWSLLFIIPGIIKSYEYRMIPYILSENPEISRERAFEISKKMMKGNKWNTFVLDLSFLGWQILSGITIGILGIFYVNPYVESTNAELYAYLREDALKNGYVSSSELIGF